MLNNVSISGRLCSDPELRTLESGTTTVSVVIACDRDYVGKEGQRESDFIPVTCWRGTAEFLSKHFAKGDDVSVTGRLQSRTFESDGKKERKLELVADNVYFCGRRTKPAEEA